MLIAIILLGLVLVLLGIWIVTNSKNGPQCTLGMLLAIGGLFLFLISPVFAQEHKHKPEDAANHLKFYQTWMMPDNRAISCCHDEDCTRAEVQKRDGSWYARPIGDKGEFAKIPKTKIEHERDSPDGSSHLCGRRYGFSNSEFTVFCFLPASGS